MKSVVYSQSEVTRYSRRNRYWKHTIRIRSYWHERGWEGTALCL